MNDMTDRDTITLPREVAYQVPLHELLESVPSDARLVIDDADGMGTAFIPVGRYCHEAAAALRTALAAPSENKTPAWWRDGLAATLMREGVSRHRAREIAVAHWEAYCQIPKDEEEPT